MALTIQAVVSLDTKMFTAGIRGIEAQVNQFAGLAMMQFGGVAQQISAMWGAFGPAGAAISALGSITQVGAGYEQQMARVASYTQAAGDEMARLASDGIDMVAKFGFSAQQVGESMASLALAGVETANMTDVLQASLLLASATLGDANQSAELITSTLKVFQEDMAKAGQVADLFAGAIASSPLDLQRLSDSMKYAGATGAAFGMSMQQVVDEIAAFHQVGLRGQMAGTSFRGALLEMSAAASSAKGVVGAALQGWDAGTEGLTGAVRRLNDAGADASVVIQELGKRAGPGVAALMKLGADAMEDLSGKIRANSSVSAMHEKQMDTLAGQYKLLQGEITALATKIYNHLVPGLRDSLSQIRGGIQTFTDFASKISGLSGFINAVIPGIVRFATTVIGLNAAIKSLNFVGINTGLTSIGGLFSKMAESRKAAADLVPLREELARLENQMHQIKFAGSEGMIGLTDSAKLSDLTAKAENARTAFTNLQAQGAQPFIDQAAFAAMPQLDELRNRIADSQRYAYALQESMRRIQFSPDPAAQAQWKQLAEIYRQCGAETQRYYAELSSLEETVRKTGMANFNAALAQSEKGMNAAAREATKFQSSLSDKSLKAYNAALAENEKATKGVEASIKKATNATGGWSMGLSKLQVGFAMASAAMAGWQLGSFIANIKIADRTVSNWLANSITSLMGVGAVVEEADADVADYIKDMREHCRALRDAGRDMANTFINELPRSTAWADALRDRLDSMDDLAKKLEKDLQAALSFGGTDIASQLEDMKNGAAGFKEELGDAFDSAHVQPFIEKVTAFEQNLSGLADEVRRKNEEIVASKQKEAEIADKIRIAQEQIKEYETQIAALKSKKYYKGNLIDHDKVAKLEAAIRFLNATIGDLSEDARDAATGTGLLEVELGKAKDKLADAAAGAQDLIDGYDDLSTAADEARTKQAELNELLERQAAEEAAHGFDVLADAIRNGLDIDAARTGFEAFGDTLGEYIDIARDAGLTSEQTGQNIQWMAKNQDNARGVLERLGIAAEQVTAFMVKYGEHSLEVARRMATLGESEEEAAQKAGALGSALEEPTAKLKDMAEAVEGSVKPLMSLGAVSQARLTRIIGNIKALGDALGNINGGNKIDLSWLTALGSIVKLPRLTGVDGWLEKFDALATGIGNVAANMAGVNLDWMAKLKDFSLPNLGGIKEWKSDFSKWAAAVRTELPTLERFADALSSLQGSLSALNDATLKIVFKDESLLSRIEGHLSTLASLKGVIWA